MPFKYLRYRISRKLPQKDNSEIFWYKEIKKSFDRGAIVVRRRTEAQCDAEIMGMR